MKRLMCLLLALLLGMGSLSAAAEGKSGNIFACDYYVMTLPEDWIFDTEDLTDLGDYRELGYFYPDDDEGIFLMADMQFYEDWEEISLWEVEELGVTLYAQATVDDFEDEYGVLKEIYLAGDVPFLIIQAKSEDGAFYYADTLDQGRSLCFYAYWMTEDGYADTLPDTMLDQLKSILDTFRLTSRMGF